MRIGAPDGLRAKTLFDNSKAGKFTPITRKRLRSPRGLRVWITYKFCSSMLSSAVDYKADSVKHLKICTIDSRVTGNRTAEEWDCRKQGGRVREKPRYSHRGSNDSRSDSTHPGQRRIE